MKELLETIIFIGTLVYLYDVLLEWNIKIERRYYLGKEVERQAQEFRKQSRSTKHNNK